MLKRSRYNNERPRLGHEYIEEVQAVFDRIHAFPDPCPIFSVRARRCLVRCFPYPILYQVRADRILVLAIMHLKRDPNAWRQRATN